MSAKREQTPTLPQVDGPTPSIRFTTRLDQATHRALDKYRVANDLTISQAIRKGLRGLIPASYFPGRSKVPRKATKARPSRAKQAA